MTNTRDQEKPPVTSLPDSRIPMPRKFYGGRRAMKDKLKETRTLAMEDQLTGLPNRRWFVEDLKRKIAQFERTRFENRIKTDSLSATKKSGAETGNNESQEPELWILLVDFDDFKAVNTVFTHDGGDQTLKLANVAGARKEEAFSRIGGEEFTTATFLTKSTDTSIDDQISIIMSRYMNSIEQGSVGLFEHLPLADGINENQRLKHLTFSFGAIKYTGQGIEEIIAQVSNAKDHAKAGGKNCGFIADQTTGGSPEYRPIPRISTQSIPAA